MKQITQCKRSGGGGGEGGGLGVVREWRRRAKIAKGITGKIVVQRDQGVCLLVA